MPRGAPSTILSRESVKLVMNTWLCPRRALLEDPAANRACGRSRSRQILSAANSPTPTRRPAAAEPALGYSGRTAAVELTEVADVLGRRRQCQPRHTGERPQAGAGGLPARLIGGSSLTAEKGAAARLLGRRRECAEIDRLLADAAAGASQVLVLRGDAGVGKSALLSYLASRPAGWRIASAIGVESEMELAYSGLHQLCAPLLDRMELLPVPQRDALATVFGLSAGPAPERFLVGLATLSLVAEAADQRPLVCIVDDAQWLDKASAQIMEFVARRLLVERVVLVAAARTGVGDHVFEGLPTLTVGGLGDVDARTLLLGSLHGVLDSAVCDQIVVESRGNPLALLELPRTWRAADLAGGFRLPESQSVGSKIEQSYVRRIALLPSDTQLIVLAAAAEPLGDRLLLHRASQALGLDMAAVTPAVDEGLLVVRERVEFSHPLVRSAAYRTAGLDDRQRVHRALAEATDAKADPDRRAWHRARAVSGLDEEVAGELVRSAGRAQSRGGIAAAAAFLARATELTPAPATRVQRALDAASAGVQAAAFDSAGALLSIAREGPLDEMERARIDLVSAQLAFASSRGGEATPLLLAAARRLEALDIALARETYIDAFAAALFGARFNSIVGVPDVARAARAAPRPSSDQRTAADLVLDAFTALTAEGEDAVPPCRAALEKICGAPISASEALRWSWHGTVIALELWDDESAFVASDQHLRLARTTGALSELALALSSGTPVLVFCGEVSAASSLVSEASSVQDATGVAAAPYGALILAAWRGDADMARELIDLTMGEVGSRGEGIGVAICEYARAVLCNGSGRYDEALDAAHGASDYRELVAENWGLTELIEAATRVGRTDLATDALDRLTKKAQAAGTSWALGVERRSRALVSEGEAAEGCFRDAITYLSQTRVRAELARSHLLYGEWLRRINRRVDARAELGTAFEMFAAMGLEAFAERTHRELLATGATARKRTFETRHDLTAQEAHIARLARDGRSNPEIGAQLFISARTVEWHLRKVFTKLGISSRKELRVALPDRAEQLASR
jgi:DNA-binding CsgD family transcriptional regulator